jgi:hypothetical protein
MGYSSGRTSPLLLSKARPAPDPSQVLRERSGVCFFLREITEKSLASSNAATATPGALCGYPCASLAALASGHTIPSP